MSNNKVSENASGKFYVDESCTLCQACINMAPDFFAEGEEFAYVEKQPQNEKETEKCEEALKACPEDSIHDDGESE